MYYGENINQYLEIEFAGKPYQNKSLGNRELYSVLYLLAMQQIQVNRNGEARNPEMRAYFEYKVSKGKIKIHALICTMRRLVRIYICHDEV